MQRLSWPYKRLALSDCHRTRQSGLVPRAQYLPNELLQGVSHQVYNNNEALQCNDVLACLVFRWIAVSLVVQSQVR